MDNKERYYDLIVLLTAYKLWEYDKYTFYESLVSLAKSGKITVQEHFITELESKAQQSLSEYNKLQEIYEKVEEINRQEEEK